LKEKLLKGERISAYLGMDATGKLHCRPCAQYGEARRIAGDGSSRDFADRYVYVDYWRSYRQISRPQSTNHRRAGKRACQELLEARFTRFLSFEGENPCEVRYNGDWYEKMTFAEVIKLSSEFTVQQMLERDMFEKRMKEGKPIFMHEFFYPLMQGYDSVMLDVDLEIGGNDQTFNMLAGRDLIAQTSR
jgi:tyrosyl-tRNA synthetase